MRIKAFVIGLVLLSLAGKIGAAEDEYSRYEAGFKNFLTCELTRPDAIDHFKKIPFTIAMIRVYAIQQESGIQIITGAVKCFVKDRYETLYAVIGVENVADRETVSYYTIRKQDFSILASELIRFPYKDRCPWSQYWVDLN